MSELKRYAVPLGAAHLKMVEEPEGEWIRYDDIPRMWKRINEEIVRELGNTRPPAVPVEALEKMADHWACEIDMPARFYVHELRAKIDQARGGGK